MDFSTDFWWQCVLNPSAIQPESFFGICLWIDGINAYQYGIYRDYAGAYTIRIEKLVNGVGSSVWSYSTSSVTSFGVEWRDNQARFCYNLNGWQHTSANFGSLSIAPTKIGTFYKEWRSVDVTHRFSWFQSNYIGIYDENGS